MTFEIAFYQSTLSTFWHKIFEYKKGGGYMVVVALRGGVKEV